MSQHSSRKNTVQFFELATKIPGLAKDLPKILTALYYNYTVNPTSDITIGQLFQKSVLKYPERPCVIYHDQEWTYREFNLWINRLANHFIKIGIKKGDVVAVLLENRPEILAISLALAKIGGITALLNTSQRNQTLLHSIQLAKPKLLLIGSELTAHYLEIKEELNNNTCQTFLIEHLRVSTPKIKELSVFDTNSKKFAGTEPIIHYHINAKDAVMYIYTSGTTGLPKASIISHLRWIKGYSAFGLTSFRLTPEDRLYVPLPFYHATAMIVCWSSVIAGGASIILKNKFSVKDFWNDIDYYQATGFGYVGEMCVYLLNTEIHPKEKNNTLVKMIGNGLRPEIWKKFKDRFSVEQVCEFYASSEGNIAFFNVFNIDETMGFSITNFAIVAYDQEKEDTVKDKKGYLQKVNTNEVGLLLGEITDRYPFDGYTEKEKSESKVLRNVFKNGDAWFNTGDLVRDMGYLHTQFVDRLGDTFRWKGENVSTIEVEGIINQYENIEECMVYGVEIPNCNGRAGMVNIILKDQKQKFNFEAFYAFIRKELPPYAIPIFIRFSSAIETTTTFKHQKVKLKQEGFDYTLTGNKVYALIDKKYTLITKKILHDINNGVYRF